MLLARSRPFLYLLLGLFCLCLPTACPRAPQAETQMPPPPPRKAIAPGQSVLSEFPADGEWHSSGYLARPGDRLKFRPLGEAAHLEPASLQLHIGRSVTQQVASPSAQAVTLLGEIKFRVDKTRAADYPAASIQIEIANERAPE